MSRAFLLEPVTCLDVRNAERFGNVEVIFPYDGARCSMWDEEYKDDLFDRLDALNFSPRDDFIVLSGNMSLLILTVAEMISSYGYVNALLWNSQSRTYIHRQLGNTNAINGSPT